MSTPCLATRTTSTWAATKCRTRAGTWCPPSRPSWRNATSATTASCRCTGASSSGRTWRPPARSCSGRTPTGMCRWGTTRCCITGEPRAPLPTVSTVLRSCEVELQQDCAVALRLSVPERGAGLHHGRPLRPFLVLEDDLRELYRVSGGR
jgi:hypothetical protein